MPESWAMVDFDVPEDISEMVSDVLWSLGVLAVEERPGAAGFLTLRTSLGDDPTDHLVDVCSRFEHVAARVVHVPKSISETWREHAVASRVVDDIMIVPAWVTPPPGARSILVEPRDTFGLGNHPTTLLALRMALRHATDGDRVLDFGCGSGVLAIGLSKITGSPSDVYDIADSAQSTVAANCRLNSVDNVRWNSAFDSEEYDLILANILAPVLREESVRITSITRHGGIAILSGIRDEQVPGVKDAYRGWIEIDGEVSDGWACIALRNENARD